MSGRLAGKVALVTAAGAGIGRASAELFAAEGAMVHAVDIDVSGLAGPPSIKVHKVDLTDAQAIAALPANTGPVDILFNCAGFVHSGSILECEEDDWAFTNALNVGAMYRTIRAYLPGMLDRGTGSIVNMSSIASSVKGIPGRYAYGTTKAAVIGLTKWRLRGRARGVRRPPADGAARPARGNRRARALSGERRVRFYHRRHPHSRRRLDQLRRHPCNWFASAPPAGNAPA